MTVDLTDVLVPVQTVVVQPPTKKMAEPESNSVADTVVAAKPEAVIAAEPTDVGLTETEEARRAKAQEQFDEAIKAAERELIDANLNEEYAKENLKAAKANRTECLKALQKIRSNGVEDFLGKLKAKEKCDEENKRMRAESNGESKKTESQPGNETATTQQPEVDDSWKLIPTDAILSGIEGLGQKKIDVIVDEFKTLGALEAAREIASKEFKPFHKMFPKGIGEKITDQIEERMFEAMKRYMQVQPSKNSSQQTDELPQLSAESSHPPDESPQSPTKPEETGPQLPDVFDL